MLALRLFPLLCLLLVLTGCGGGPRQASVPYGIAGHWMMPMTVEVVKTWDLVRTRVDGVEPQVTHLVEVVVITPPPPEAGKPVVTIGDTLVLPFDSFATGTKPPGRGERLTMTAAEFVRPAPRRRRAPQRW